MKFRNKSFLLSALVISGVIFFTQTRYSEPGSAPEKNNQFSSFSSAKKALYRVSEKTAAKTFYCGCDFDPQEKTVQFSTCGYSVRSNEKRASRTEVEHVMPASRMCGNTTHWVEGHSQCVDSKGKHYKGRKCAERYHPVCKKAVSDLRNLRPAIGEVNGDRSNHPFGEVSRKATSYGKCNFVIENKTAQPDSSVRGDIARIYQFMALTYPTLIVLTQEEHTLYSKWSRQDPVSPGECRWNREVAVEQGAPNTIVQEQCDKMQNY